MIPPHTLLIKCISIICNLYYLFCPGFERKDIVFDSQSENLSSAPVVGKDESHAAPTSTEQITAFADEAAGWTESMPGTIDRTRSHVKSQDTNLGNFMERPVRIQSIQWDVGTNTFVTFDPWYLFFNDPTMRSKLARYELLKANLNVKVVVTGTPFHYGRALMSYSPLPNRDETLRFGDAAEYLIRESQKPHIFLDPTENSGGEMVLPFFWDKDYLSITRGDIPEMGRLNMRSFQTLKHANDGDDPVTISVYAWASDVELTMPTAQDPFVSQSMEYGQGIISKPATAVAKIAGMLSSLPQIGPFALATQMGASSVAKIAQLFGFCRTPILSSIQLYKPIPQGNLANVDAPEAVSKLSLDSKQELSIDPRITGLAAEDELSACAFSNRESYVTRFGWDTAPITGDVDALLWNTYVTPTMYAKRTGTTVDQLHLTPMAHMSQMFDHWQGSITFRFVVVASKYHKGRLLFRFDPNSTGPVDFASNYSRVVDIAEERDFEITLGWAQALAFLNVATISGDNVPYGITKLPSNAGDFYNGILEVNVLNKLVSPSVDSPVEVLVFARMNEDCVFAKPDGAKMAELNYFPEVVPVVPPPPVFDSQSQEFQGKPEAEHALQPIADSSPDNQSALVYFGEVVPSLRCLFKRYTMTRYWAYPAEQNDPQLIRLDNKNLPLHSGWDPNGVDLSVVDGTTPFSLVNTSPISYLMPCFAAWRGSLRRKYYIVGPGSASGFSSVTRFPQDGVTPALTGVAVSGTDEEVATKTLTESFNPFSYNGTASTLHAQNRCIEVDIPFYSNLRFKSARILSASDLDCDSHKFFDLVGAIRGTVPAVNGAVAEHVATGEDFSLYFFTGVPVQYVYSVSPSS